MDIFEAVNSGNIDQVRAFLDQRVDPNTKDETEQTALHKAIRFGGYDPAVYESIIRLLLERGADVNAKDEQGLTPLHLASMRDMSPFFYILLERGADVNAKDWQGNTPLHYASQAGSFSQASALIDKGANVNAANQSGRTPIFFAVQVESESVILVLVRKGAHISIEDRDGKTPISLSRGEIRKFLTDILSRERARAVGTVFALQPVHEVVAGVKGQTPVPPPPGTPVRHFPPGFGERMGKYLAFPPVRGGRKTRKSKKQSTRRNNGYRTIGSNKKRRF